LWSAATELEVRNPFDYGLDAKKGAALDQNTIKSAKLEGMSKKGG